MCGRYDLHTSVHELMRLLSADLVRPLTPPGSNIAPTRQIVAIREPEAGRREAVALRWGLIPSWSKDSKPRFNMINARAETIASKPAYRAAYRARRCLIPANGFYEWQRSASGKQPYYITTADEKMPFLMAGVWERWRDAQGESIESCAIITTEANGVVANIHDRMPVILDLPEAERWISPAEDPDRAALLRAYPDARTRMWPVSKDLNKAEADGAQTTLPLFGPEG